MEDNQPNEKVTGVEETTPPKTKTLLERCEQSSQQRIALEKKVAKPRKSAIERKVETLEKKVAILEKKVAKHDKVFKELTETLSSQMTKIDRELKL